MKVTPGRVLYFDYEREEAIRLNLAFFAVALVIVAFVSRIVSKSSVQDALIRAKKLGTAVKVGGKVRSV